MASILHVALTTHPSNAGVGRLNAEVELRGKRRDVLGIRYSLDADMSRVRLPVPVPVPGTGKRADGLWRHTCFEAFVAFHDVPGYYEFNFSPSLDWAVYRFDGYREGMSAIETDEAPAISVHRDGGKLELRAAVSFAHLGVGDAHRLRIGLAAVIEDEQGGLSYWAVRHPPGKPDFHHSDGFALELDRT